MAASTRPCSSSKSLRLYQASANVGSARVAVRNAASASIDHTLYRAAVPRQAFCWRKLANLAVQLDFASIPSSAAMVAFPLTNPLILQRTVGTQRHPAFHRGLGARSQRLEADRCEALYGRQGSCDHSGQDRLSQRSYRADRTDYRERPARTDPHRTGLDHEILHSA